MSKLFELQLPSRSSGRRFAMSIVLFAALVTTTWISVGVAEGLDAYSPARECVCGPKRIVVLLFDFADVKHTKNSAYYSHIVREMNASYYRQSYGKMWIVGGEVYGWYETSLELSTLKVTTWNVDWTDADKLQTVARVKANELKVVTGYVIAVFAGDVWAWATGHPSKTSVVGETRWGLSGFMHEFGHNLGLPDLYNYANLEAEPVGKWDLMDSGDEELSAYSRYFLGWLPEESVMRTYSRDATFLLNSLESPNGTRLVRTQLPGALRYLLTETRRTNDGLRLVIYRIEGAVESGTGSIVLEAVLVPWKSPIFYEKKVDTAFMILDSLRDALKVKLADEAESQKAQDAINTIISASTSIDLAWYANRVQGLEGAKAELNAAKTAFSNADFGPTKSFAESAKQKADGAMVPESYGRCIELYKSLQNRLQSILPYKSDQAIEYVNATRACLREAEALMADKDYDGALAKLLSADENLTKAAEAENQYTQAQTQTNLQPILAYSVIALVIIIIVAVIIIQKRRPRNANKSMRKDSQ